MLTAGKGDWGLGIALATEGEDLRFSHTGINEGFRAGLWAYPQRRQAVVIMSNGDNGNSVLALVRRAVGRVFGWPGSEPQIITPVAVKQQPRLEQVGHYTSPRFSAHVGLTDEGLILVPQRGDPAEAIPQGEDVYAVPDGGGRLEFKRDPGSGRITGLTIDGLALVRTP
jgi:hypothetical protein